MSPAHLVIADEPNNRGRLPAPGYADTPFAVGRVIPLPDREVVIGRSGPAAGVHLTLPSNAVNKVHAELRPAGTVWVVRDLGGRNGTYQNGVRVAGYDPVPLADGDRLEFPPFAFLFRTGPLEPGWLTGDVIALARGIREDRAWDRLPILADALRDTGCAWDPLLDGCRPPDGFRQAAWVAEYLLRAAGVVTPAASELVAPAGSPWRQRGPG